MARRERAGKKAARQLEVRVSFEPNRLAEECLEQAYARVAPVARRAIGTRQGSMHAVAETFAHRLEGGR